MLSEINQRVYNVAKYASSSFIFIGLIGVTLFPLYYYIFQHVFPQPYENLPLRIVGAILFFPIMIYGQLPNLFKKYFSWYFLFSLSYAVTFFCPFMVARNHFSLTWIIMEMGALFLFIIVIYDWIIALSAIIIGLILSYLTIKIMDGYVAIDNINFEHLPFYFLILLCAAIIRYKNKASDIALVSLVKDLGASIAHEMRGPLGSINQSISMVIEHVEKLKATLPANFNPKEINEIKELIEMIERSVVRGNMAIDMILKNIQEKKIDSSDFKAILMSDVIRVVMKEYAFATGEREKVFINYANDFYFKGDENLMVFTLFNLIKNSLYYMKLIEGGRIDIWMQTGSTVSVLHFKDNGPGIAKERLAKMFENYKTYGKKGGTGLGLPFCRRAMTSFSGSIKCFSEVGEWTEFVMSFPISDSGPLPDDDTNISTQEIENLILGKTILLVDDDNLIRMVMEARLRDFNVTVIEARQGKEAIEILDKNDIDLVFMDIQMPEIDGLETTKQVRSGANFKKFQNYKDIPIIALTGNAGDDKEQIKASGMNGYLDKSMSKEELFIALRRWLKNFNNKSG